MRHAAESTPPVARIALRGVRRDGSQLVIVAALGRPGFADDHWRCPVALTGLHDQLPDIAGEDSMQALLLGARLLHRLLTAFRDAGGRLYFDGSEDPSPETEFPLEAYFGLQA